MYGGRRDYVAGGRIFEGGLFEWEADALSGEPFPSQGRVLITAAGAGRETRVLAERGFQVVAFEPSSLAEHGLRDSAGWGDVTFLKGSHADFVSAVTDRQGPLASIPASGAFDAVIIGWEGMSYLSDNAERIELLRAVRRVAPEAPLLISYIPGPAVESRPHVGRSRFRGSKSGDRTRGGAWRPITGFFWMLSDDDVDEIARDAGYEVVKKRRTPYGHAVLVPAGH